MSKREMTVKWTTSSLSLPDGAVDFAAARNGAVAHASATDPRFTPAGANNGQRSLQRWGSGNGWQAPPVNWHPHWWGEWLEVAFPRATLIDSILVFLYPAMVQGKPWRVASDFFVQFREPEGDWVTLKEYRDNHLDVCEVRFAPVRAAAIRVFVTRNRCPEQDGFETGSSMAISESPRILEIEAYLLSETDLWTSRTRTTVINDGERGRIAIFRDPGFAPDRAFSFDAVSALLSSEGYGVTFLDAEEVCSPNVLNARNFDVFVHPYGEFVPVGINIFDFLQGCGHLMTFGGRAFTNARQKVVDEWKTLDLDPEITVSAGRYLDNIRPYRDQLGLFSIPFSRVKNAKKVRASPEQSVVPQEFELDASVEGWMACGLVGELLPLDESARYAAEGRLPAINHRVRCEINRNKVTEHLLWGEGLDENYASIFSHPCARWLPLLDSFDEFGRARGPVGAVLLHYEGVYRGSNWAFFGIENVDLSAISGFNKCLVDCIALLLRGPCIHSLEPDLSCYRQGEAVTITLCVDNLSSEKSDCIVRLDIHTEEGEASVHSREFPITLDGGGWTTISDTWEPGSFDSALYRVSASLLCEGRVSDAVANGFVVWDEERISMGPRVEFKDNFFHFDGEPRYVIGARDSGFHLPGQPDENPLGWDAQYAMMRDFGMRIVSPVHFDWYLPGLGWGEPDADEVIPAVLLRRMDAQVQLAQKHGLIYAPCLFFNYEEAAMRKHELSRRICQTIGARYAKVPGIMFYIFDDGQRLDPEHFNGWAKVCVDALNSSDRTYIVTAEYDRRHDWADVLRETSKHLSFVSSSHFKQSAGDPAYMRLMDMRVAGKSMTEGEFVRRMPRGSLEDFQGYLAPPHISFGMGFAMSMNWKWGTSYHTIWPSDVVFPGRHVPKDHLYAFRNEAQFFGLFKPHHSLPDLFVLLPTAYWRGNPEPTIRYLSALMRALLEARLEFACLDEWDLHCLPKTAKALIYPLPLSASNEICEELDRVVAKGINLLLIGDIPCGLENTDRSRELSGVRRVGEAFSRLSKGRSLYMERYLPTLETLPSPQAGKRVYRPWILFEAEEAETIRSAADGTPLVTRNNRGKGDVWFTADIDRSIDRDMLSSFAEQSGIDKHQILPDLPQLHCFRTTVHEGLVYLLYTFPWDQGRKNVELKVGGKRLEITLKDHSMGILQVSSLGKLTAAEAQGLVQVDGRKVVDCSSHFMVYALDGKDLAESDSLVLWMLHGGTFTIYNSRLRSVDVGEIFHRRWVTLASLPARREGEALTLLASDPVATAIILLSSSGAKEQTASAFESHFGTVGRPMPDTQMGAKGGSRT